MIHRTLTATAVLAATAAFAGCGQTTIETSELEAELKSQLGADAGVEPRSVECPNDIEAEKGKKFDCTLTAPNGDEVRVEVTLTDDEGGFEAVVPPQ